MGSLSENQIDYINDVLINHGIGYDELRHDLLDHVCCMIEKELNNSKGFEVCLEEALQTFGKENFKVIQESTLYLLNQKLNKMKKITSILGLMASSMVMAGVYFKVNHLMGASILLVLGVSIISLIVLPLFGYMALIAKSDKQTIATTLVGYSSVMLMAMGGLSKLMLWPWANILFWTGLGVLLIGFLPLYTMRSYRLAENKLFSLAKSMLVLAGFVFLVSITANSNYFKIETREYNVEHKTMDTE